MNVFINSVDITENVKQGSLQTSSNLTDQVSSGSFVSLDLKPSVTDVIEIKKDGVMVFSGFITGVRCSFDGYTPVYNISFIDNTIEIDQLYVIERYEDKTVEEIVNEVIANYLPAEYTSDIDADITISEVTFNYKKPSEVFEELAETINYEWYVDQNKVIKFFEKGSSELTVSEDEDIVFWETITYEEDIEQLKNKVYVKGGNKTSTDDVLQNMDEQIDGTNDILKTGYTYIYRRNAGGDVIEPVFKVNSVQQEIGIENEDTFDAISAELSTTNIKFTAQEPGTGGNDISVEFLIDNPNQSFSVSVIGNKISVYLESNYLSESRTTAQEVVDEVNTKTSLVLATLLKSSYSDNIVDEMTETSLSGGADGKEYLYNQDEKVILCNNALEVGDKPVTLEGRIRIPIEIVIEDKDSQDTYNLTIEHIINDSSISSTDEAEKKALAELERFAESLESGTFETNDDSFVVGKVFRFIIPDFNVDDNFCVRSVNMRDVGGGTFRYTVGYMTERSKRLLDLLKQLIKSERAVEQVAEILAKIDSLSEQIEIEFETTENPFSGDDIDWVAGPYFPINATDTTRSPRVGGGAKAL
jgi:hypothetical protein